jgi:hypothetical protein
MSHAGANFLVVDPAVVVAFLSSILMLSTASVGIVPPKCEAKVPDVCNVLFIESPPAEASYGPCRNTFTLARILST